MGQGGEGLGRAGGLGAMFPDVAGLIDAFVVGH
jgi:hypothetical protein